ncbi:hypothetical protein MHZ92_00115 [Sporosarcina sp. ACRSL]|uniref:hypothetical protein n=1 Tax=Sporosarcina sp. ACRSL TaxID=2918215 RepID=UPI001EF4FED7|nr:hypothetical protein [Sporosarcina sp. ACRSL]MCG7342512.1 hypothetical protein [Sporosarcina sp. ACRSL]
MDVGKPTLVARRSILDAEGPILDAGVRCPYLAHSRLPGRREMLFQPFAEIANYS